MTLVARPPSQELVNLVGTIGGRWHGNVAHALCPAHSDQTPSLTLRQGDRGILVTCFAGCTREDILRELGRVRPGQQFKKPPPASDPTAGNDRAEQLWMLASDVRGRALKPICNSAVSPSKRLMSDFTRAFHLDASPTRCLSQLFLSAFGSATRSALSSGSS